VAALADHAGTRLLGVGEAECRTLLRAYGFAID
jgi:hypothetical protein